MINKKAQEAPGSAIAVLIALIALFMVLYILMLPPETREELLNQSFDNETDENGNGEPKTLLLESPGEVFATREDKITHTINPLNLYIRTEPEITTLANSLYVSRTTFSNSFQYLTFNVEDLSNLEDASLSFSVINPQGKLSIDLNNHVIYEEEIRTNTLKIIKLPVNFLTQTNTLKIYTNSPGLNLLGKNHYTLNDVRVKQEFEMVNSKEERTFTVPKSEKDNLKSSKLEYLIYCNAPNEETLFKVYLNDKLISSELISCMSGERTIEIDEDELEEGRNKLMFVIDVGDYLVSDIKIINKLKEKIHPLYYFDISKKDYDDIEDEDLFLYLTLTLEDGTKRAKIYINDNLIHLDTTRDTYSKDISELVMKGENFIKIIPETEFTINVLKIRLEEE